MTKFTTAHSGATVYVQKALSSVGKHSVSYIEIARNEEFAREWFSATETRAVIAALQATLPADAPASDAETDTPHTITTAAELDALPVGARVVDCEGDTWTREADGRCWRLGVGEVVRPSSALGIFLPAIVLDAEKAIDDGLAAWERELLGGDESAPAAEKSTTAGTLRLDLRLFLGDRDITYALANPIADALEG